MKFSTKVVSGRGIGRELGFPTLNFEIPKSFTLDVGVYVCKITTYNLQPTTYSGVLFFGSRKTFDEKIALEIHVLNTNLQKSPAKAEIEILDKIRGVKKFKNQNELIKAIQKDCEAAKNILAKIS